VPNASILPFIGKVLAIIWRASQDSNLEPSDLESDALPIRATDPALTRVAVVFAVLFLSLAGAAAAQEILPSRWVVCERHLGQNFLIENLSVWVFLFLVVV
jgi:hypothetical protein